MGQKQDALRMLRTATRQLKKCETLLDQALERRAEVRLLELHEMQQTTRRLSAAIDRGIQLFQPSASPDAREAA